MTPDAGTRRLGAGRLLRLCRKELREVLRDRRTIITLIGMPLLVYPLLSLTFQKFLMTSSGPVTSTPCIVGFESASDRQRVSEILELGREILARRQAAEAARQPDAARPGREEVGGGEVGRGAGDQPADPSGRASAAAPGATSGAAERQAESAALGPIPSLDPGAIPLTLNAVISPDVERRLAEGSIDIGIRVLPAPDDWELPGFGPPLHCELFYRQDSALSQAALELIQSRLEAVNRRYLRVRLVQAGGKAWFPAEFQVRSIGTPGSALSITTVVPLILILMTITGAVYPAIDVTAGERERGTLEALMAAPVPRLALLAAKYVAVLTVAVLTAAANLAAMTITLLVTPWGRLLFDAGDVSLAVIAQVFLLLILFAAFFSAILLAITSFARSFKEAQAYLIPVMLLALAPGIISLMPGLEFNGLLAVTPLVNMVLLARELLEHRLPVGLAALAVCSTILYAVAAIAIAARIFGTDALLSGSRFGWRDLLRPPSEPQPAARPSGSLACLAVMFPAYFMLSNLLSLLQVSPARKLLLAAAVTMLLFGGLPLLAARLQRVRLRDGFALKSAHWLGWLAAAVLGLSLWPIVEQLFLWQHYLGLETISEDKMKLVQGLLDQWRQLPPALILFSLALTPAVFEEFFFRGYLFTSLREVTTGRRSSLHSTRPSPALAVILSAILFGLFHVVTANVLAFERFLPSTLLGLVLGWVCWRCGSIGPGILLHACHNGLLLMMACYRDQLADWGFGTGQQESLPWQWLVLSAIGAALGWGLLMLAPRRDYLKA